MVRRNCVMICIAMVILITPSAYAQVTADPSFPTVEDEVTIFFDATLGTGGLKDFDGEVYAHTGVITEASTSFTDWKFVKTEWGENTSETLLERIDDNQYQLVIGPSIKEYYGVPENETVTHLAFVFRSADTNLEGKADGGADIIYEINTGEFSFRVDQPSSTFSFYEQGETISVSVSASEVALISGHLDGSLLFQIESVELDTTLNPVLDGSIHELTLSAKKDQDSIGFVHTYSLKPSSESLPVPDGLVNGANYLEIPTEATLVLTAPGVEIVHVMGDFNNWVQFDPDLLMKKDGDRFWITIDGLVEGQEYIYQYIIDGDVIISDPYAQKVSSSWDDPEIIEEERYPGLKAFPTQTSGEAAYLQPGKSEYNWQVQDFKAPDPENLMIYELLVRDFSDERTYKAVTAKLDYLDSLGINAIELMPVTEFEGNLSWGYNPSHMMAPDKYYGSENDLKHLIDEAHKRGIAVIVDMVFNHQFGRSPLLQMLPIQENPWFNAAAKHPFNVGTDMNHESTYTQQWMDQVNRFWLTEYKVDGFRFDLTKGFTQVDYGNDVGQWSQYDASRIAILKRMADAIWAVDDDAYVILEHLAVNEEEAVLADYGMLLWGNMSGTFYALAEGGINNIEGLYHDSRGWSQPNLVSYMESHDEERVAWKAFVENESQYSLEYHMTRLQLNAAFFFMVPGPKMIWQFGEFGYDEELNNDRLGIKPTRWEYLDDPDRRRLFLIYQSLINLRTKTGYINAEYFSWKSQGSIKWIQIDHPELQIIVYGNFNTQPIQDNVPFQRTGTWYDYFTGETLEISNVESEITIWPGEFRIYTSERIENYIQDEEVVSFVTGFNEELMDLVIFPNPSSDEIIINSTNKIRDIEIFDFSGRAVFRSSDIDSVNSISIDIKNLREGIYYLTVYYADGNRRIRKVLKQ